VENLVIGVTTHTVAMLNRYPYNAGHLLIAPRQHCANIADLESEAAADLMSMLQSCVQAIQSSMHPHAVNIGANLGKDAGAGVPDHLHFHIVPRWHADTNFMTVLSETRVINESLAQTWAILHEAWENGNRRIEP